MLGRIIALLAIAVACGAATEVSSTVIEGSTITGLKVSSVSPCILSVTWNSSCITNCNYTVTYTGPIKGSTTTKTTTVKIPSLLEGNYTICVADTKPKDYVTPLCVNATIAKEAPGKVEHVSFGQSSRNLTVKWTPAETYKCTAPTKEYILTIQESGKASSKKSFNVPSSSTNYTVTKLTPCTDYAVSIEVMSDVANTTSGSTAMSTSAEAPSKPNVTVIDITPATLHIKWSVTAVPNCNISSYIVKWKTATGTSSNITLNSTKMEYTIDSLTESSAYTISVTAVTTYENTSLNSEPASVDVSTCGPITSLKNTKQSSCGFMLTWENDCKESYNYTVTWQGQLNGSANIDNTSQSFQNLPTGNYHLCVNSTYNSTEFKCLDISIEEEVPEKVQNVTIIENSRLLTVTWAPAKKYNCTAVTIGYMLALVNSENVTANQSITVPSNYTDYTFKKLTPCTEYIGSIEVLSDIANITSDDKMVSTSAEAPSKPTITTAVDISPDTLFVNWTASATSNCNISSYIVEWRTTTSNITSNKTLASDKTEFSISNLTESEAYIVGVTAITTYKNVSLSSETSLADVSTCGPVNLINTTKQNSCGFVLSWENNCPQNYNYTVTWKGPISGSINTNNTSHSFQNLPTGNYRLCINSTWNSQDFKCLNASIEQEAPGQVENVVFAKNSRNLTVTWTPAKKNNCTVGTVAYLLTLQKSVNASVNQTISVSSNTTNSTFKHLEPCTDYTVSIDVISIVANTSSGNLTASTSIEAPSKPAVTIVGISPDTLHANWTVPAVTNCNISNYIVKWGEASSNITSNKTLSSDTMEYTIDKLSESSAYTISVTAVSTYGNTSLNSEPASVDTSTCGPVNLLNKTKQNSCGFLLSWKNNCTQSYNYTVTWWGPTNGSITTDKTNQSFQNLKTGSYQLSINSTWNPEDFKYKNTSIEPEAPGKVKNVTFTKDSHILTVSWSPGNNYKCTATTKGYTVILQKSEKNSTKQIINVPSNKTDYTFKKLEPCTGYTVSVDVVSDLANATSGNMNVSTSIEAPGKPKTTTSQQSSDSILVRWTEPIINPCPIAYYNVSWRIQHSNNTDMSKKVASQRYTISGLKHNTTYSINVTAVVSYHNNSLSSSSELQETTGNGSSPIGNVSYCSIIFIALLSIILHQF